MIFHLIDNFTSVRNYAPHYCISIQLSVMSGQCQISQKKIILHIGMLVLALYIIKLTVGLV